MTGARTYINVATFLVLTVLLVTLGMANFVTSGATGPRLTADFVDATGVSARNDVTMRGIVVGTVGDVDFAGDYVRVTMELQPGTEVPNDTTALIVRRSPIGELTIELDPGTGPPIEPGGHISVVNTEPPPDVSTTIEVFADILHAVPSEDIGTVVSELATALRGRSADIAKFADASLALPERLLEIQDELESLIRNGPKLTGVLADNATVFADDITQTAILADILRDKRFDLVDLNVNGARFLEVAADLLSDEKANLACFIKDSGKTNAAIAARRGDLIKTLAMNHFFFDGVRQAVRKDPDGGTWFRVQLLPHQEPSGETYAEKRPVPDVFPGRACSNRYGNGVDRATGKSVLPETSKIHK